MDPGSPRDQIRGEDDGPVFAWDLRQHQTGRMSVGEPELVVGAERIRPVSFHDLETAAVLQKLRELGDEGFAVARVGMLRTLERIPAHDEIGVRKEKPHRLFRFIGAQ